ncbi:lipopolysaccharide transport periplasmic protein LptA [Thermodesulfobacteriota bacterium]
MKSLFNYLIFIVLLLHLSTALAETKSEKTDNVRAPGSIVITSNTFEVDDSQNIVIFSGAVDAKMDEFTITCNKMVVHYLRQSGEDESQDVNANIDRIIATGAVKIIQKDGGEATAEKATYFQNDEKIILTGRPVVKRGNNVVEGSNITVFIKENRSIVEGSEDSKARAVLHPNEK